LFHYGDPEQELPRGNGIYLWFLEYNKEADAIVHGEELFDSYETNDSYVAMQCVPKFDCLRFNFVSEANATYVIKQDGEPLPGGVWHNRGFLTATNFGDCPSSKLSAGAITGIAVVGVFVLVAILTFFAYKWTQNKKSRITTTPEVEVPGISAASSSHPAGDEASTGVCSENA
jgi:hypothetical protein